MYLVRGNQVACDHINNCASNLPVSITIRLRDCSPTRCTISSPEFWAGDFPFTLVDGFWSVTATRLEGRADCHGVPIPSVAFDLTLTPGAFVIDANGVWRANSLTGPARRYSGAFKTCAAASQTWNAVAKRIV